MSTFYDFMKQGNTSSTLALPSSERSSSTVVAFETIKKDMVAAALSSLSFESDKAMQFGLEMAQLVTDDSFLKDLSNAVQTPMISETRDQFIRRCQDALIGLMEKKLKEK